MKAVHFGAGNIGRGFVGLLLHEAGYEVVFADVNAELIDELAAADSYVVHEVGEGARDHTVTGFRAINSAAPSVLSAAALFGSAATSCLATATASSNCLSWLYNTTSPP